MPGLSSGLSPIIVAIRTSQTATDTAPVCKFPIIHTMTDSFVNASTTFTTNTSTTHARIRLYDGATTGTGTATVITISSAWVADTQKANTTNYTFAANDWAMLRYCEAGTVELNQWGFVLWAVAGNV